MEGTSFIGSARADAAQWEFTPPSEEEAEPQKDKATVKKLTKQRDEVIIRSASPRSLAQLVEQFYAITRKWSKSDGRDTTLNLTRELVRNRLRIQSFEIDPYVRGRSVYHRHGNIVGNGLVRCVVSSGRAQLMAQLRVPVFVGRTRVRGCAACPLLVMAHPSSPGL